MIKKVKIINFKCFEGEFNIDLKSGINIIVGDNDAGKSTILEAIHLVLSGWFKGKNIKSDINQYLFNKNVVNNYIEKLNKKQPIEPPEVIIEVYLDDDMPNIRGDNFLERDLRAEDTGISIKICLDEDYRAEYNEFILSNEISYIPVEYYKVHWKSFARDELTARTVPLKSIFIDAGFSKFNNGSDLYIAKIIKNLLEPTEEIQITQVHRKSKSIFAGDEIVESINAKIAKESTLSNKNIELAVNLSSRSTWEGGLITEVDKIPFDFIGKGEQSIIKTDLALSTKKAVNSSVILLEEPESHISHSKLNKLLSNINNNFENKQLIISTHSSFVINKLGMENITLINNYKITKFDQLSDDTYSYFRKVAGYDTLRLILCEKAILVEGDSDELIVQRAYLDKHGCLPLENGIDVISVGTSFLRFLQIATLLNKRVSIVTDNDGNLSALQKKYNEYKNIENIKICHDEKVVTGNLVIDGKNFNYNTLEPCILRENSLELLNKIFNKNFKTEDEMHKYMKVSKTECALSIFDYKDKITYPKYIVESFNE